MSRADFLDELEVEFNNLQPYTKSIHVAHQDFVTLTSWHETTKDLDRAKPLLPSSRIGIPVVPTRPNTTGGASDYRQLDKSKFQPRNTQKTDSPHSAEDHNNFVKTDMSSMCSQGWNLSHGWFNRPKAVQIKDDVVAANINKWASRMKRARAPAIAEVAIINGNSPDDDNRFNFDENDWNSPAIPENNDVLEDNLRGNRVRGKPFSTPGPRYNIRDAASRIQSKRVVVSRGDDSTVRDIRFGTPSSSGDKLRRSYLYRDVVPLADSSAPPPSPASMQFMKMFESKRNFVGSIYEQQGRVCGPGPGKYNTLKGYSMTSKIVPVTGTFFAPVGSNPRELREQHIDASIPKHKPPKPLW